MADSKPGAGVERLVMVGRTLYAERDYVQAMVDAGLAHLQQAVPRHAPIGTALAIVEKAKTPETAAVVLTAALMLLRERGKVALPSKGSCVVAKFPDP